MLMDLEKSSVAPHAGAWIETSTKWMWLILVRVAPHAGAWIETDIADKPIEGHESRTPCGCVD